MRFANIITALSGLAVSGVLSSPVDQANNARIGTATEGNVTATVEMVKTDDGADVARITYTTVDVEHPEKFSAPVTRICWNIFREYLAFKVLFGGAMNLLNRKNPSADSSSQRASPHSPRPWCPVLRLLLLSDLVRNRS